MSDKKLDPRVSEFDTEEQAASYDRWFRAKVEAALKNDGPRIPHDEVVARIRGKIQQAIARHKKSA